ncbi:Hypothetical predicted protein [Paramuricea clavata]|uniref:Uncharacterized protein n=1 Tax=Paramuricea clavata TaxID=317549 RepID=A0A6S7ITE6_PARCT|nr:Hypothetical predicted protein [Paramuricea clavata]
MSNNNRRRKRDCQVLNRKELYEKYIPHISRDFAKIVDKSKNNEFKQRCQQLLKVDDPSKIQEAIAAQLFKLTLGNQYNVNVSQNTQENPGQQSTDEEEIQSCFGDLAGHIDDEQWPIFNEHSSLPAENMTEVNVISSLCTGTMAEVNTRGSCSGIQDTDIRLSSEEDTLKGKGIATSVSLDDDNFNSLELHAMFDEASWEDTTTGYLEDQRVPYGNITRTIQLPQNYQPALQQSDTSRMRSAPSDSDAVPSGNISSIMQTLPQNYQPALHQSDISRMRSVPPHSDAVPCGVKSTIVTVPQHYQPVLQRSGTSRAESALTESDDSHFETLANMF